MSIILPGTLNVQTIQGRRGSFNVAKLATSIGVFDVKNPVLMKFAPGEYSGNFVIEQIKVKAYEWNGGATSYIDAALDWAELEIFANECGFTREEAEEAQQPEFNPYPENGIIIPEYAQTIEDVAAMIGRNWEIVQLGEYVLSDRELLGEARNLLREAGYRFQPQNQSWHLQ